MCKKGTLILIHPSAVIDPSAEIADGVEVGPYVVIGKDVSIDAGCKIHSHVVISGPTRIGNNNQIFQFASIGEACQDKKYKGERTWLKIGNNNVIREGCTIHRGTIQDKGVTRIGNHNLLMAYVHVAHDVNICNGCVIANNAALAGHVHVGDGAILGGYTTVHQFCAIAAYSMSAAHTAIFKDVPAYVMVSGNPAKARGMNFEGMRRRYWSEEKIRRLKEAYKVVYNRGLLLQDALILLQDLTDVTPEVKPFMDSLQASDSALEKGNGRGFTR